MNQDVHDGRWHSALGTPKLLRGDPGHVQAYPASVRGTSRDPEQGTRISRRMG